MSISKRIVVMNGWVDAPHCWRRYILLPFQWDRVSYKDRGWIMFSVFGFAFFWLK